MNIQSSPSETGKVKIRRMPPTVQPFTRIELLFIGFVIGALSMATFAAILILIEKNK